MGVFRGLRWGCSPARLTATDGIVIPLRPLILSRYDRPERSRIWRK